MTNKSKKFLKIIKKVQITEMNVCLIDFEKYTISSSDLKGNVVVCVDISKFKYEISTILDYLISLELVELMAKGTYQVVRAKHKAWHLAEERFKSMFKFTFVSIIVPIVVAALTTLITLWINQQFP